MKPRNACCSFCRKSHTDVGPLVEGSGDVYICGECIELCQSIIQQEQRRHNPSGQPVAPALLREKLDQIVSEQDEAKQVLALAAGSRNDGGGRVLLIGQCRSAVLLLARALAHALEVPFAAGDSTSLVRSKHGSVDVVPLLFSLLHASDFDVETAQRGVVFVDGAERLETQDALLQLWQENISPLAGLQLAVSSILFVCGGTFVGIDEAVAGLDHHPQQPVTVEELRAAGVRPDWAGCLAGIARVAPLDEASLVRIVNWVDFRRCDIGPAETGNAADGSRGPGF